MISAEKSCKWKQMKTDSESYLRQAGCVGRTGLSTAAQEVTDVGEGAQAERALQSPHWPSCSTGTPSDQRFGRALKHSGATAP